jgi:hypothetical protein
MVGRRCIPSLPQRLFKSVLRIRSPVKGERCKQKRDWCPVFVDRYNQSRPISQLQVVVLLASMLMSFDAQKLKTDSWLCLHLIECEFYN